MTREAHFVYREASDRLWILIGVFFSFMPMGLFALTIPENPGNWFSIFTISLYAGLNSVAWAAVFVFRRLWLLLLLVPSQYLFPRYSFAWLARQGLFDGSTGLSPSATRIWLVVAGIASMVVGYILVMRLARRFERRGASARAELDVASAIHKTLVPDIDLRCGTIRVIGSSIPSNTMGGDLIDAVVSSNSRVDVLLADVSGHGVGAGIVMGMVKASARTLLASATPMDRYFTDLNRVLCDLTSPEMFSTAASIRLEPAGRHVRAHYALAGHHPIVLRRSNGEVLDLVNDALPLGISPDESVHAGELTLYTGDTLLVLTDGLIEVQNAEGRELGFDVLRDLFEKRGGERLDSVCSLFFEAARAHGRPIDDQSVLLVRIDADPITSGGATK